MYAVIQVVLDGLFDDPKYKCGCQCKVYESAAGDLWRLSEHGVGAGKHFWPFSLRSSRNPNGRVYKIPSEVLCKEYDYDTCGVQFSEPTNVVSFALFCAATHHCCGLVSALGA